MAEFTVFQGLGHFLILLALMSCSSGTKALLGSCSCFKVSSLQPVFTGLLSPRGHRCVSAGAEEERKGSLKGSASQEEGGSGRGGGKFRWKECK